MAAFWNVGEPALPATTELSPPLNNGHSSGGFAPETCQMTYFRTSASAVIGGEPIERRLNVGLPPFKYVGRGNSGLTNLTGCLSNSATHPLCPLLPDDEFKWFTVGVMFPSPSRSTRTSEMTR